jgi:hypothetical protein
MPPCKSTERGYEEGVAAPRRELAEEHWARMVACAAGYWNCGGGVVEEVANLELILWRVWLDRNKVTQAGEFLMQLDRNMKLAGVRDAEGKGGGNMAEK